MKRFLPVFFAFAAILFLAGCDPNKEDIPGGKPGNSTVGDTPWLSLNFSLRELVNISGGAAPTWKQPRTIRLIEDNGDRAVLSLQEDGSYSGTDIREREGAAHIIVLPSDASAGYSEGLVTLDYPSSQEAFTGTIPEQYALGVGYGTGKYIPVYPVFGGLLLSFERDDIIAVSLKGRDGEQIPGKLRIDPRSFTCATLESTPSVRVQSASGYMKKAIMVLPPVTLKNGFIIEVESAEGRYSVTYRKSADFSMGKFTEFLVKDEYVAPPPVKPVLGTGLRTMFIETPDGTGIWSKELWVEGCKVTFMDDDGKLYYENSEVSVKGRGNSTWSYAKKPYTIKLPEKEDLIGHGKSKRYVLLANWMDRTLLRNDVSFELARRTSLEWTPSGEFIELYLDGKHIGNYWLGEHIKVEKSRLQADFLIEMDTYYDATWRFYSSYGRRVNQGANGMPIGVKEPDDEDMNDVLFAQLKDLVNTAESTLYSGGNYKELFNINSFIDWYLVHEVAYNGEPNHPKSCYFYFRNGVMYAGPVWDFDWYTFQPNTSGLFIPQSIYFGKMMQDREFVNALKERWAVLKPLFADVTNYIDTKASEIRASESINWSMWPCTSSWVNGDERMSFDQAVTRMKSALESRISAVDRAIAKL